MRLRKVCNGKWTIWAVVTSDGACELLSDLEALAADKKTKSTAAGFAALWSKIPNEGPHQLGTDLYHQLDSKHSIYEFRKRNHRILCFQAGGRIIICSHIMLKTKRKVPKSEIGRAIKLRNDFLEAQQKKQVDYLDEG